MKTYILDTNVLALDPYAIFAFEENERVITMATIEELDAQKRRNDSVGANARLVARLLADMDGDFQKGVRLPDGGILRIETNHNQPITPFNVDHPDNRILAVCKRLQAERVEKNDPRPVILVTNDRWLSLKARAYGIEAQEYKAERQIVVQAQERYTGRTEIHVPSAAVDEFFNKGYLTGIDTPVYPWQFVTLKALESPSHSAIGIYNPFNQRLERLQYDNCKLYNISPRNTGQRLAMELLMRPEIRMVTIEGPAGTGKTLIAVAAGLHQVMQEDRYDRLIFTKPTIPVSKYDDQGALPGDLDEKLDPWMRPFRRALLLLFRDREDPNAMVDSLRNNVYEYLPIGFARGESFPEAFMVLDEAQNLDRRQTFTLLTRPADQSKVVLMGDTQQIDNPFLDETNNGLSQVIERFKDSYMAAHITLTKVERDPFVEEVVARLSQAKW